MDTTIPWTEKQLETIELTKLYQIEKELIYQIQVCNTTLPIILEKYQMFQHQSNMYMISKIEEIIKKIGDNNYQRDYNLKLIQKVINVKDEFVIG